LRTKIAFAKNEVCGQLQSARTPPLKDAICTGFAFAGLQFIPGLRGIKTAKIGFMADNLAYMESLDTGFRRNLLCVSVGWGWHFQAIGNGNDLLRYSSGFRLQKQFRNDHNCNK
jgi:hypothetical protein